MPLNHADALWYHEHARRGHYPHDPKRCASCRAGLIKQDPRGQAKVIHTIQNECATTEDTVSHIVAADVGGPYPQDPADESKYVCVMYDYGSEAGAGTKAETKGGIFEKGLRDWLRRGWKKMKFLYPDNPREAGTNSLLSLMRENDIRMLRSRSHRKAHGGVESLLGQALAGARVLILSAGVDANYGFRAMLHFFWVRMRTERKHRSGTTKTPTEWQGEGSHEVLKLADALTFGTKCYGIPASGNVTTAEKISGKGVFGTWVGFSRFHAHILITDDDEEFHCNTVRIVEEAKQPSVSVVGLEIDARLQPLREEMAFEEVDTGKKVTFASEEKADAASSASGAGTPVAGTGMFLPRKPKFSAYDDAPTPQHIPPAGLTYDKAEMKEILQPEKMRHHLPSGETSLPNGMYAWQDGHIYVQDGSFWASCAFHGEPGEVFLAALDDTTDGEPDADSVLSHEAAADDATGRGFSGKRALELRFGFAAMEEAWNKEYSKHTESGAFVPVPPEYKNVYRERKAVRPIAQALYKAKKHANGQEFVKCRFVILWNVVQRSQAEKVFTKIRATGSTPSLESIRLLSIASLLAGQKVGVIDEESAYINTTFDWRFEGAGKNMPLCEALPFPLFSLEQADGTSKEQMLRGNINGVRGAPACYEKERDSKFASQRLYRSLREDSLKLGPYTVPGEQHNVHELEEQRSSDDMAYRPLPRYPWSRTRSMALTHVVDSLIKSGDDWPQQLAGLESQIKLKEGNRVTKSYETEDYGVVELTTVEFRGIEITTCLSPPLLVHSQLQYLTSKYPDQGVKIPKTPVRATLTEECALAFAAEEQTTPQNLKKKMVASGSNQFLMLTGPHLLFPIRALASAPPYKCTMTAAEGFSSFVANNKWRLDLTPGQATDTEHESGHEQERATLHTLYDASFSAKCSHGGVESLYRGSMVNALSARITITCASAAEAELATGAIAVRVHENTTESLVEIGEARFGEHVYDAGEPLGLVPSGFSVVSGDNTAAQHVIAGAGLSRKSRGMAVNGLFVRQRVQHQHNRFLSRIDTHSNSSDILTKILPQEDFNRHAEAMGIFQLGNVTANSVEDVTDLIGRNFDAIRRARKKALEQSKIPGFKWSLPTKLEQYSMV
ncbi:unnamed protein product [Amoebophrya sp. A25]|nr:unnamed protein product [Amoebophrya sp. A25]|eukprot:GSA25T00015820001.1